MNRKKWSGQIRMLHVGILLLSCALGSYSSRAQNAGCGFSIDTAKWYTGMIYNVSWNPTGNKLLVTNGFGGTYGAVAGSLNGTYDHTVVNASDTSTVLSLYSVLSKNVPVAAYTNSSTDFNSQIFTPNGGAIYNSYYVSPSGVLTAFPSVASGGTWGHSRSIGGRDTTVFIQSSGTGVSPGTYTIGWLNDNLAASPVFGTVPVLVNNTINIASTIVNLGNRIYYTTKAVVNSIGSTTVPVPARIKCITFAGAVCPNWNDVVLSTGQVSDMQIRPTDSLIFARTESVAIDQVTPDQEPQAGGVVIFNQNGVLASGFNFTDMSLMAQSPKINAKSRIRFDAAGNIFANITLSNYASFLYEIGNQVGIVKFDPQGNLDLSFYRNMLNNYDRAKWSASSYFDVNPVTGMIASGMSFFNQSGQFHAKMGGSNVHGNNVPFYQVFPDNGWGSGSGPAPTGYDYGYNDGYKSLHLYYNNGKLKVKGEGASYASSNCGSQPPVVIADQTSGYGTIQCNQIAFMAAPVQGTASTIVLKVPVLVDTMGTFKPITVSGSGMSLQDPNISFHATTIGLNFFYLTMKYNGGSLGQFNVSVGNAGACTADLTDQTKRNPSIIEIWTPENCTFKVLGPDLH